LVVEPHILKELKQTEEDLKEVIHTLDRQVHLQELPQLVAAVVDLEVHLPVLILLVGLELVVVDILVLIQVLQVIHHQYHHHKETLVELVNFLAQLYILLVVEEELEQQVEMDLLQHLVMVVLDHHLHFLELNTISLVVEEEELIRRELQVVVE
jgi:hypothetical protein